MNPNLLNRLCDEIDRLLRSRNGSWSELELLKALSAPPLAMFPPGPYTNSLVLFQVHFSLFHALYHLRQRYYAEQVGELKISALQIQLQTLIESSPSMALDDRLARYYLDWNNYRTTKSSDVDSLLEEFWKRLFGGMDIDQKDFRDALSILELKPPADYNQIKRQYRRLVMQYHPDRGGSTLKIQQLNDAMERISRYYSFRTSSEGHATP